MPSEQRSRIRDSTYTDCRIQLILGLRTYTDRDQSIRIPLWISNSGRHVADIELTLPRWEAVLLREQLAEVTSAPGSVVTELLPDRAMVLESGATLVSKVPHPA
ncbi:hypothetical protein AB0L80_17945 [Streptomyces sp. NPDC052069]|uniref:hypothetical protein n=1 Tax=Streptomyces sp. NPDC052069 TaxID=3154650 RepID=UPI0034191204